LDLLDGLPLAIAQASAFLQETGVEPQKYIEFYKEKWEELMKSHDWEGAPLQDYPDRSVWTTWAISFSAIRKANIPAANLLLLWALLDSKDLWHGLFAEACRKSTITATSLSEWIGDIPSNELEFTKAMRLLRNYSLIEDVQGLGSYATHPVVHRWAYYFQGEDSRLRLAQLAVMVVGCAVPYSSLRDYFSLARRLLPHAQACSRWIVMNGTRQWSPPESGSIEIKLAEERFVTLGAVHMLGYLYADQGKLAEAEKLYQLALQGKEKALGAEHISTLNIVNNLGVLYRDQGRLAKAEKMFQRALQGKEKAVGAEHTSTLKTVNNLGVLYRNQGKLAEAEKMYQRALQGKEKALEAEHISTLDIVHNLGILYLNQGKLAEAEKMFQQALQGYKKPLGTNFKTHIPALRTIWGLASVFERQADFTKARIMYSEALDGFMKVVGPGHPDSQELLRVLDSLDAETDGGEIKTS
jgi:tetratricopeptide (TPR) repeat protein